MATRSGMRTWSIPRTEDLAGYNSWGRRESDTTKQPSMRACVLCFVCCLFPAFFGEGKNTEYFYVFYFIFPLPSQLYSFYFKFLVVALRLMICSLNKFCLESYCTSSTSHFTSNLCTSYFVPPTLHLILFTFHFIKCNKLTMISFHLLTHLCATLSCLLLLQL